MNRLLPKVLIFLTFFGSCIVIGFLLSALVTTSWVTSEVIYIGSTNATSKGKQRGTVELGLFSYSRSLNYGYGERHENFSVLSILKSEQNFMDYWLWMFTALATGFALFSSAVAAVASVIGTIKKKGGMALMLMSNIAAGIGQVIAFLCWVVQFFQHIKHNVLLRENFSQWTSSGEATFGYSFLFIVFAFIVVVVNLTLLMTAIRIEKRHRKSLEPIEEKEGNSIMLY